MSCLIRWCLVCAYWCWRCMSRVRNCLKPNFSNYWGNWFLAPLIAFFVGFLPAAAFSAEFLDPAPSDGYYWCLRNYSCETTRIASPLDAIPSNGTYHDLWFPDPTNTNLVTLKYWVSSTLITKQYVRELGSVPPGPECPNSGTAGGITVTKYDTAVLPEFYSVDSCKFTVTEYSCSQPDLNNIQTCQAYGEFSGDPVQSGDEVQYADPEATAGDPPKPCYTTDGRYIGTVSANVECPANPETRCYNQDGTLAYLVESSSSCPENTSPDNESDATETNSDIDPVTGEKTGSSTNTTTKTETTTTTTTTNPDGSTTTTSSSTVTTEEPAVSVSEGLTCEKEKEPVCEGDPLQCYQIKQQWRDSCGKHQHLQNLACNSREDFICEGSPIDCFIVKSRRDAACEAQDADGAVKAIQDGIASGAIEFDGTDEWGQLNSLDQGEFNVSEQFDIASIWNDNGNQGTCPAPLTASLAAGGSFEFSFQPMCDLAGYIRALVILSAMWISGSMISQVLAGTRYTH